MTLRPGDRIEFGVWLAGGETPEHIRQFMTEDAAIATRMKADEFDVAVSQPTFTIKRPGDEMVPDVPAWLERQCNALGRRAVTVQPLGGGEPVVYEAPVFLVVSALVTGLKPSVKAKSFLADLEPKDLARLRAKTKDIWNRSGVGYRGLTDQECDRLIEQHGPDAAYAAVLHAGGRGPSA